MKELTREEVERIREDSRIVVGTTILRKRQKDGCTQEDVAEVLNVNRSEISKYENGTRDMLLSSLFVLGECLGFDLMDIMLDMNRNTADLYEEAIYRSKGVKKTWYTVKYVNQLGKSCNKVFNERKNELKIILNNYFGYENTSHKRKILVIADALYDVMKYSSGFEIEQIYKCILDSIEKEDNKVFKACLDEYRDIVLDEIKGSN